MARRQGPFRVGSFARDEGTTKSHEPQTRTDAKCCQVTSCDFTACDARGSCFESGAAGSALCNKPSTSYFLEQILRNGFAARC